MFEALTDKLQGVFRRLGSRGTISERDLDEALREVRLALLEADVNFKVVRQFVQGVKERALGAKVLSSLTPRSGRWAPRCSPASRPCSRSSTWSTSSWWRCWAEGRPGWSTPSRRLR